VEVAGSFRYTACKFWEGVRVKVVGRFLVLWAVVLAPMVCCAEHKPPILTTTAIIEIQAGGEFKGIVLIERG